MILRIRLSSQRDGDAFCARVICESAARERERETGALLAGFHTVAVTREDFTRGKDRDEKEEEDEAASFRHNE